MLRCFGESSGLAVERVILAMSWWRPARRYMESALLVEQCRYFQCLYEGTILVLTVHYGGLSVCLRNKLPVNTSHLVTGCWCFECVCVNYMSGVTLDTLHVV